jgi:hypothetical protein
MKSFIGAARVIVLSGYGGHLPHLCNPLKYLLNLHKTSNGLIVSVRDVPRYPLNHHHR